jgi:hypothetical protein
LPPWRSKKTGVVRDRCYAANLNDCDGPLSSEHFISAKLLRRLEQGGGVNVRGFPWQGEEWKKLPVEALGSKILCTQHNSDLSALDDVGERLVDHLERVDTEFQRGDMKPWLWVVNGHDIERWLLKTLCGLLLSKSGRTAEGESLPPKVHTDWVRVLYGARSFPEKWGLHVVGTVGHVLSTTPKNYFFAPVSLRGDVVGIRAELVGHAFTLLLTGVDGPRQGAVDDAAIYRPRYLRTEHGGVAKTIYFHWDQRGAAHHGVQLTWSSG